MSSKSEGKTGGGGPVVEGKASDAGAYRVSDAEEEEEKLEETEEDASEAFAQCMAATLAGLFDESEADDGFTNGFALPGMQAELSIFCRVADWWGETHASWFKEFADQHCHHWDADEELRDASEIECKLEWTALHHEFLEKFEEIVEAFIRGEGSDLESFVGDAEKLLAGVSLTLFEDSGHTDFLNSVFSCLEYTHFHNIMVNAGRRKKYGGGRQRKHKGKSKKEKRMARAEREKAAAGSGDSRRK
jgi:hypothetical protein